MAVQILTAREKCDIMNVTDEYRRRRMRRLLKRMKEAETQQEALRLAIIIYTTCFNRRRNRDGGPGSGNFGHKGRPGEIGGSAPSDGAEAKSSITFGGATTKHFAESVVKAKSAVAAKTPEKAWRVTAHTQAELDEYYPGAVLHTTNGGSTVAVTADGDIISVCGNPNDTIKGRELIKLAVDNGGIKLDSYSGNHGFYVKCGFEPVSWCEWDDEYAPKDWSSDRNEREPIIFYKYSGNKEKYSADELNVDVFLNSVKASADYDAAKSVRDNELR